MHPYRGYCITQLRYQTYKRITPFHIPFIITIISYIYLGHNFSFASPVVAVSLSQDRDPLSIRQEPRLFDPHWQKPVQVGPIQVQPTRLGFTKRHLALKPGQLEGYFLRHRKVVLININHIAKHIKAGRKLI